MNSIAASVSLAPARAIKSPLARGLLVGLTAASIGALYTVFARWGIARGMDAADMTLLRFGVAGLLTLPLLALALKRNARDLLARWRSWVAVALLAGPLFGLLMFTALQWAPAAHAAVFPFTAMSVMGTLMSAVFPALAQGIGAFLAWPVLGHVPTAIEAAGLLIAVTGLLITVTAGRVSRAN